MKFLSTIFVALFLLFNVALATPAQTKCKTKTLPIPPITCILNVLPPFPTLGALDAKTCTLTNHHRTHTVMTDCKNCKISTLPGIGPGPARRCSTTVTTHIPATVTSCSASPTVTCK